MRTDLLTLLGTNSLKQQVNILKVDFNVPVFSEKGLSSITFSVNDGHEVTILVSTDTIGSILSKSSQSKKRKSRSKGGITRQKTTVDADGNEWLDDDSSPTKTTSGSGSTTVISESDMAMYGIGDNPKESEKRHRRVRCPKTKELIEPAQYQKNKKEGLYDDIKY